MDTIDLALLLVSVRAGALADMLQEIIRECPEFADDLLMARNRLDGTSAEVEQVLLGGVNRARRAAAKERTAANE